jgi:hypothetical protein
VAAVSLVEGELPDKLTLATFFNQVLAMNLCSRNNYVAPQGVPGGAVLMGKKFGLRAWSRSKANRNLRREESTPETLACYSTSKLGGALAKSNRVLRKAKRIICPSP